MAFVKKCLFANRRASRACGHDKSEKPRFASRIPLVGWRWAESFHFLVFSAFAAAEAEMAKLPPEGVSVEAMQIFNALSKT